MEFVNYHGSNPFANSGWKFVRRLTREAAGKMLGVSQFLLEEKVSKDRYVYLFPHNTYTLLPGTYDTAGNLFPQAHAILNLMGEYFIIQKTEKKLANWVEQYSAQKEEATRTKTQEIPVIDLAELRRRSTEGEIEKLYELPRADLLSPWDEEIAKGQRLARLPNVYQMMEKEEKEHASTLPGNFEKDATDINS